MLEDFLAMFSDAERVELRYAITLYKQMERLEGEPKLYITVDPEASDRKCRWRLGFSMYHHQQLDGQGETRADAVRALSAEVNAVYDARITHARERVDIAKRNHERYAAELEQLLKPR